MLAAVAWSDACFDKMAANISPLKTKFVSYPGNADAGFVKADGLLKLRERRHLAAHNVGGIQTAEDDSTADTVLACNILNGKTGRVVFDSIINTETSYFSGHVYNLETTDSFYVANGIITHNCRCVMTPTDLSEDAPPPKSLDDYLGGYTRDQQERAFGARNIRAYRRGEQTAAQLVGQKDNLMKLEEFKRAEYLPGEHALRITKDFQSKIQSIMDKSLKPALERERSFRLAQGYPAKSSERWVPVYAGDAVGHEFHGNQWTQPGQTMSGRDVMKRLKAEGHDKAGAEAVMKEAKAPIGTLYTHKHEVVERIRLASLASKGNPDYDVARRSAMPQTQAANEMLKSGMFGKSYGLENTVPRQSVGGVYSVGGYVHSARPTEDFKKDWVADQQGLRERGFHMGSDDGGDLMKHTIPISKVSDWQNPHLAKEGK